MNFQLAREIYSSVWCTDIRSISLLASILNKNESFEEPEERLNNCYLYNTKSETRIVYDNYDLESDEEFQAIGVININGPITVNGGMSSYGMKELSQRMRRMAKDERVKSFLIKADSGGGSSAAVEIMSDAINEVRNEYKKRVDAVILEGGMAASACFGILTACDNIYSESEMNIVGSAGTMIEFIGRPANEEGPDGYKNVRVYATKSTKKNAEFEAALNDNNFKPLIDNLLDPINERFLNLMMSNRPLLKGSGFDDANTKFAKDVVGTYIDGIKSVSEVIQELTEGNTQTINNKSNISKKFNSKKMTVDQLKSEHPEIYNKVFNSGVSQEKDRAGAWLAHVNTDSKAVVDGIKSGENITMTQTQEFLVKQNGLAAAASLRQEANKSVQTQPSGKTEQEKENEEAEAFYKEVEAKLK